MNSESLGVEETSAQPELKKKNDAIEEMKTSLGSNQSLNDKSAWGCL